MRKFTLVSPSLWKSKRFLILSDAERLLFAYYLTSDHQNCAGCFHIPDAYACADLRWTSKKYLVAQRKLVEAGIIQMDRETSEVLIERWFHHNSPTNSKHYQGVMRCIEKIESAELRAIALKAVPTTHRALSVTPPSLLMRRPIT